MRACFVCNTEVGQSEKGGWGTNADILYLAEELLFPGLRGMGKVDGLPSWAFGVNLSKVHNCSVMQINIKMPRPPLPQARTQTCTVYTVLFYSVSLWDRLSHRFLLQKCPTAHGWNSSQCYDHYSATDLFSRGFTADHSTASLKSSPPISHILCPGTSASPPCYWIKDFVTIYYSMFVCKQSWITTWRRRFIFLYTVCCHKHTVI